MEKELQEFAIQIYIIKEKILKSAEAKAKLEQHKQTYKVKDKFHIFFKHNNQRKDDEEVIALISKANLLHLTHLIKAIDVDISYYNSEIDRIEYKRVERTLNQDIASDDDKFIKEARNKFTI